MVVEKEWGHKEVQRYHDASTVVAAFGEKAHLRMKQC